MAVEEETNTLSLTDKITLTESVANRQQWIMLGFLAFMLLVLVLGILSLGSVHKAARAMSADKPENRFDSFRAKISLVHDKVEEQYQQHLNKMQDQSILTVNEKFNVIYQLSQQSERDYVALLELYQKIAYDSASRIKGSGEWYYYYQQKLAALIKKAKARESKMRQSF